MENFTPVSGLIGGALIGAASVGLALTLGRIAGISGIVAGLFDRRPAEVVWRAAFVAGLVIGPIVFGLAGGNVSTVSVTGSLPLLIVGGLIVGFGTRLGGGCTSGHGVCGLARLSPRSLVATPIFMAVAGLTVFVLRHVLEG